MFMLTPIALGSWWAVPVFLLYFLILVWRILNEGKVLRRNLPGYYEYCKKIPYRFLLSGKFIPKTQATSSCEERVESREGYSASGRIRPLRIVLYYLDAFL
jgi:hypothetical protein